jgi:hypothetical protein
MATSVVTTGATKEGAVSWLQAARIGLAMSCNAWQSGTPPSQCDRAEPRDLCFSGWCCRTCLRLAAGGAERLAILWQASFVAEAFAEVFDEFDPRLGTATQTFEDRSTRTRDHAGFAVANLEYRKTPCQHFQRFSLPPSQTSSSLSLGVAQLLPLLAMRIVPPVSSSRPHRYVRRTQRFTR